MYRNMSNMTYLKYFKIYKNRGLKNKQNNIRYFFYNFNNIILGTLLYLYCAFH